VLVLAIPFFALTGDTTKANDATSSNDINAQHVVDVVVFRRDIKRFIIIINRNVTVL